MQEQYSNHNSISQSDGEDIKFHIYRYLKFWPFFLLSIALFIVLAFFYLKYSTPIFNTSTDVKVLDDKEGGLDLSGLSGSTTLFNYSKVNLENEIQVFKSRRLIGSVISDLNLNTNYFKSSNFGDELLFKESLPFTVTWGLNDTLNEMPKQRFVVKFINNKSFEIYKEETEKKLNYKFSDTIKDFGVPIVLNPNLYYSSIPEDYVGNTYIFNYIKDSDLIRILSQQIKIDPVGDRSDILKASINGPNESRNEAILNSLVRVFNQDGIEDKRLISKRTGEFVEERLEYLVKELDTVESGLVDFKEANDVVTVESSAEQLFSKEASSENKKFEVATQIAVAEEFKKLLLSQEDNRLLPANLGIESPVVNDLTLSYNNLILDRNRLLISSTEENPVVLSLNSKLEQLKKNILSSVESYLESLRITFRGLQSREGQYSGEINNLPQKEKEIRTIIRQQSIKERLYLFLLQKREEAALSYAITTPTIKVVDFAYTNETPVAPKKKIIYLAALFLGLVFPFAILYVKFLLNTKISNREDLEAGLSQLPILGEVPKLNSSQVKLVVKNDQSILAESFRILRTNLFHSRKKTINPDNEKVIFVTSSIKGEGKTFTASNLARIIASSDKKVLLIGCDLRNPQVHMYYDIDKNIKGVSDYLYNYKFQLDELIQKSLTEFKNLDVLFSGSVPPNAAELLMSDRFSELMAEARQAYDYVIVDTAPTIYVTDTLLIGNHADLTVYLVKQGLTEKKLMNHIKSIHQNKKLNNISLVLNGVVNNINFGYGYGYVYNDTVKKPFYKFWK